MGIVVYDIYNRNSFLQIDTWINDIREQRGEEVLLVIVGNKTDLADNRKVTRKEGKSKAREHEALWLETSAKSGENIEELFERIGENLRGTGLIPIG